MAKAKSHKKNVVDSKFLTDLADEIYNPKDKSFLRLCTGTLQNGPDPVCKTRTMHCGLGELYFKLTGRQPETDGVSEEEVVDECVERAGLNGEARLEQIRKSLAVLDVPEDTITEMVDSVSYGTETPLSKTEQKFRALLDEIPDVNDGTGDQTAEDDDGKNTCSEKDFLARSKAVAGILRKAAALL